MGMTVPKQCLWETQVEEALWSCEEPSLDRTCLKACGDGEVSNAHSHFHELKRQQADPFFFFFKILDFIVI